MIRQWFKVTNTGKKSTKKSEFCGTFLCGGGDTRYWLEMTCFGFITFLCIKIYIGG